jgi:thioredoxin-dependent peroxiredoxin
MFFLPTPLQPPVPITQQALPQPSGDVAKLLGKTAPVFKLPNQDNKIVNLANAKGKWLVLSFYPADMTEGGLMQNKSYSTNQAAFTKLNAIVWSVSTQDVRSKRIFTITGKLTNTLLADVGGKVTKVYNVLNMENNLAQRVTFYVAPDGKIAYIDTNINIKTAAMDALNLLTRMQNKN